MLNKGKKVKKTKKNKQLDNDKAMKKNLVWGWGAYLRNSTVFINFNYF